MSTINKYFFRILLLFFPFYLSSISMAGIAAPDENPYGTWHAEYDRSVNRILIMNSQDVDDIRTRIQNGDPLFGFLYSNNSSGYKGTRGGIFQHAEQDASVMNRTMKAFAAKNKACVYLMGLDESLEDFADPNYREVFKQEALSLLRNFDTSTGGFSDRYSLQQRARELICYLQAYDMLKTIDGQGIWEENIARRLFQFARNISYGADAYASFITRNNHRILIGSALGMAAILLGEWGSTDSGAGNSNERSYRPDIWISYAMVEINSVMYEGEIHQVFPDGGYNEGPHYLRYGMAVALPFFKAMKNFGEIYNIGSPPGDWIEEYSIRPDENKFYSIRSPWFGRKPNANYPEGAKPDIKSVLAWITKIRQPEGRIPALADTYFDHYFPETAIYGDNYFWSVGSFVPGTSPSHHINLGLSDFMETRVDVIAAGNLPQTSPSEWENMQIFNQTGDVVFRSGWDVDDIYFHIYAKDYVYAADDYDRNSHLHDDNTSFLLGFNKQVLALDCGYISWDRRDEVEGPENHNLILIDYIRGPSKNNTKAQVEQTINQNFYKFVKVNSNYWGATVKRNVVFFNERYFIINDQLASSNNNVYTFLLHGNDPSPLQFPQGAIWQVEEAKLKTLVTSQLTGGNLSTDYYLHYHDNGYSRTSPHIVLKVSKSASATQFLSVHFPYQASATGDPEIIELSTTSYAGLFADRTSDPSFGNRYEIMLSQWPVGNPIHFPAGTYGSNNRNINDIYTDADLLVMSFAAENPDDPNLIEVFGQNMTYLDYGSIPIYPNQPPQLNLIDAQTMNEGEILEVPIFATDVNGDNISFTINNEPDSTQLINNGDGSGLIIFKPDYFQEGDYTIEVVAADNDSIQLTDQVSFMLHIEHVNQTPVAKLIIDKEQGIAPLTIDFDASNSYDQPEDPGGSIESYYWDFADGIFSNSASGQHIFNIVGKYHVILTVMDNEGAIATADTHITVNAELSKIYISEVSDDLEDEKAFLELYNNANYAIDLTGFKLLEYNSTTGEAIFDFGSDEAVNLGASSTILPAKGLMVVAAGIRESTFLSDWGMDQLPTNANFNVGNDNLDFSRSKRWELRYFDGNENTRDGSLIDDTQQLVGGERLRDYQMRREIWNYNQAIPGTPGRLEYEDQSLAVTLVSLNATLKNNRVILTWTTQSEENNLGFIVQRSQYRDSLYHTIASYENVEELEGLGNSANGKKYFFIDNNIIPGYTYWYKLIDVSFEGLKSEHGPISVENSWNNPLLIPIYSNQVPKMYALYNNYPNPFNNSCNIYFDVPDSPSNFSSVRLTIYDILGREIRKLFQGAIPAGRYQVSWDGKNQRGEDVPSGVFIYVMRTPTFSQSKKMVVLR